MVVKWSSVLFQFLGNSASKTEVPKSPIAERYCKAAQRVRGLSKFVKVAYPDMIGATSPEDLLEPLNEKNCNAFRLIKLI